MLGSLMLYLKGMRIIMFQLSGFYCKVWYSKAQSLPCIVPGHRSGGVALQPSVPCPAGSGGLLGGGCGSLKRSCKGVRRCWGQISFGV